MIKQHTIRSLGKYLGLPVVLNGIRYSSLTSVNVHSGEISVYDGQYEVLFQFNEYEISEVYPTLKTYDKLINPMVFEGKEIIPVEWVYGWELKNSNDEYNIKNLKIHDEGLLKLPEEIILIDKNFLLIGHNSTSTYYFEKLTQLGFGAIANSESPTGYVDLFNYPCMAEE